MIYLSGVMGQSSWFGSGKQIQFLEFLRDLALDALTN